MRDLLQTNKQTNRTTQLRPIASDHTKQRYKQELHFFSTFHFISFHFNSV